MGTFGTNILNNNYLCTIKPITQNNHGQETS